MRAWALALGLMASPAFAQELPVKLADGATWTMSVQRDRERIQDGKAPQKSHTESTSTLTWKQGGQLSVQPQSAKALGPGSEEINAQALLKLPVLLTVDEALTPTSIVNWTQVRQGLDELIDGSVSDPKVAAATKGAFTNLSPDVAAQVLMREVVLTSLGQGTALRLGQDVPYADNLPNPLGGPPIKAAGRFRLETYDARAGRALVTWTSAFDQASASESLRQSMNAMAQRVAPDNADEARKFFEGAKIDRQDTCRHQIDIPTGLAMKVECSSTIIITAQGRTGQNVDRWTITQSLPKTTP